MTPPARIRKFTCEACEGESGCECFTADPDCRPVICCMGDRVPMWREESE